MTEPLGEHVLEVVDRAVTVMDEALSTWPSGEMRSVEWLARSLATKGYLSDPEVDSDTAAAVKYYAVQAARRKARIDEALSLIDDWFSKPSGEVALYHTATAIRSALKGTQS